MDILGIRAGNAAANMGRRWGWRKWREIESRIWKDVSTDNGITRRNRDNQVDI